MTQQLTSTQRKPTLDAESFQRILAAAYVLQEHNDRQAAKESPAAEEAQSDYTQTLSEIVETQKLIQTRQLDLQAATALIAQRLQKITSASGVAVGILEMDELVYLASTGSAAVDSGSRLALDACLAAYCLRSGRVLRCSDAKQDSRLRAELCRKSRVGSFVAVPVFQEEKVAGVVELRFTRANVFHDSDVRTSELMAGLVAEAIAKALEVDFKKTRAAERATVLRTLERIKPQLERLAVDPIAPPARPKKIADKAMPAAPAISPVENQKKNAAHTVCRACAHPFEAGELYCGNCGVARLEGASSGDIQSKWASLWYMQQAAEKHTISSSVRESESQKHEVTEPTATVKPASLEEIVAQFSTPEDLATHDEAEANSTSSVVSDFKTRADAQLGIEQSLPPTEDESETAESESSDEGDWNSPVEPGSALQLTPPLRIVPAEGGTVSRVGKPSPWTSARKSREWLESLKAQQQPKIIWLAQQWQVGRANIYMGIAALLLLIVFALWVAQPSASGHSEAAGTTSASNARRKSPPQPQLTLFEELLVGLGLAEPPPAPVYLGNPDIQVWVDLHTALYYCPGAALYGKTPGGKMTTQRDAQQDQFEPANRRVCE